MRKLIYTALIGPYDRVQEPLFVDKDFEYRLYTDQPGLHSDVWDIVQVERTERTAVRQARMLKTIPPEDCDFSVWIDANMQQKRSVLGICDPGADVDLWLMTHPDRDCVYQEGREVNHLRKDNHLIVEAQIARYRAEGYPRRNGLVASGIMARRRSSRVQELGELWYKEIDAGSHRDQLSFNYVLEGFKELKVNLVPYFDVIGVHFGKRGHKVRKRKPRRRR